MQKRGFSLMEMMVVMLIVAVIAAASAPMISKKMVQNASSDSPWIWTSATNNTIAFNLKGSNSSPATIGATKPSDEAATAKTMFHIHSKGVNNAIMSFSVNKDSSSNEKDTLLFQTGNGSIQITDTLVSTGSISNDHTVFGKNAEVVRGSAPMGGQQAISGGSAIGYNAKSKNAGTVVGANAKAENLGGTAIGYKSTVSNTGGVAIGSYSTAENNYGIAIGGSNQNPTIYSPTATYFRTTAKGERSIAIGTNATAHRDYAIAIGADAGKHDATPEESDFMYSISIGANSMAKGTNSIAMGTGAVAQKSDSIAIGSSITVENANSVKIGSAISTTTDGVAIGTSLTSQARAQVQPDSIVIGKSSNVGSGGISIGFDADSQVSGFTSASNIAIGRDVDAKGQDSIAIGCLAKATGFRSIAIGFNDQTTKVYSTGQRTYPHLNAEATGTDSIAIGAGTNAIHNYSVAIGNGAVTTAERQIVLGDVDTTVYIPGNLVVDQVTVLGLQGGKTFLTLPNYSSVPYSLVEKGTRELVAADEKYNEHITGYKASDRRLKDVGEVFKGGLEEIKKLEVFNYTFKKDPNKTPRVGVMAQDLEKVFPKAVFKGDDGFLRIRMEDMFYALVNAVKELDSKIDSILSDVKTALNDIVDLKKKSAEYEKTISILVEQNKAQDKAIRDLEKRLAKLEKKAKKSEVLGSEE